MCNLPVVRNESNEHTFCAIIDCKKSFDFLDRDFLLYKLWDIAISCTFNMQSEHWMKPRKFHPTKNMATESFHITNRVRQGDSLSPTLFSIYINDLAEYIESLNAGVNDGDTRISLLLYTDDIVLIAPTAEKLQSMLDIVAKLCGEWSLQIYCKKTQALHMKHFKCFDLLLTGLHKAEFECWPRVDPSWDRPSHISCILVSWRACRVCRWGGHLSSEITPASETVKCVHAS